MVTDRAPPGERRVGRFGWKAQHATLLAFSADAYRNEMGITNDLFPHGAGGRDLATSECASCDPHSRARRTFAIRARGRRGIDNFASFMKFLAPVARGSIDETVEERRAMFARHRLRRLSRARR